MVVVVVVVMVTVEGMVIVVVRGVIDSDGRGLMEVATSRTGEVCGGDGDPGGGDGDDERSEVVEVACCTALLQ